MRIRTGIVISLLLAVSLAGCRKADTNTGVGTAGSSGSTPTNSAGADGLSEQERALKFAQCMRDNGVPDFPDPNFNQGGGMSVDLPEGSDRQKVDSAMQKCRQYMPNGGEPRKMDPEALERARKFAQCMRDHGVKNFPDPTDEGIQINGNLPGLNPNDPTFQAAQKECDKYAPAPPSGGPSPGTQVGGGNG